MPLPPSLVVQAVVVKVYLHCPVAGWQAPLVRHSSPGQVTPAHRSTHVPDWHTPLLPSLVVQVLVVKVVRHWPVRGSQVPLLQASLGQVVPAHRSAGQGKEALVNWLVLCGAFPEPEKMQVGFTTVPSQSGEAVTRGSCRHG